MIQMLTSLDGTPASRLAFGTMQFGGRADAAASRAMFDACIEAGITHFNTAHVYTDGASERLLGQFVQDRRESLIVATKAAYTGGAGRANILAPAQTAHGNPLDDFFQNIFRHGANHVGIHIAGRDGVDRDALGRTFLCQCLGKAVNPGFCRGIVHLAVLARLAVD